MIVEALRPLAEPIDSIRLLPGNPRRGDVGAVSASLRRFGQRKPIVVRRSDRTVIAGNHTLTAAHDLGWSEIAVVFVDDDDPTSKAFALADNRTSELGSYDDDDLAAMLAAVRADDEELLLALRWRSDELDRLLDVEEVPEFAPEDEEQPRLDERNPIACPACGFEWRVGPRGEVVPT